MKELFSNIRFYVLTSSILLAVTFYLFTSDIFSLIRSYALLASTYLYLTLLVSPLVRFYPQLPIRSQYIKARRALGVSAFLFALLHATLAFFNVIGGFAGLFALPPLMLFAVFLGASSLLIFTLMAATASDAMIGRLGFTNWKVLHRLVYYVGMAIVIHALILGSHFQERFSLFNIVFYLAVALLLFLEGVRLRKHFQSKS